MGQKGHPPLLRESSPRPSAGTSQRVYRVGADGPYPRRRAMGAVRARYIQSLRSPPAPAAPQRRCTTQYLHPPSLARYLRLVAPRSPPAIPTGPTRRRRTRATPSCLGPAGGMASRRDVTCARRSNRELRAVTSPQWGNGRVESEPRLFLGGGGGTSVCVSLSSWLSLSLSSAFVSR